MKYSDLSFYCIILLVTLLSLPFHVARHSFATLMLTKGISIESVSKMLGHTEIKTTQIYAQILNEKVDNEVNQIKGELNKLNDLLMKN